MFCAILANFFFNSVPVTLNMVFGMGARDEYLLRKWTSGSFDKVPSTRKSKTKDLNPVANSGWPHIIQTCSDCQFHLFPEYLKICPRKHQCLKWQILWSGSTWSHSITGDIKINLNDYAVTSTWGSFPPLDAPMQQSLVSFLAFDSESRMPTRISWIYSSWCHHT